MYVEETDPKKPAYRLSSKQKKSIFNILVCRGDSQFVIDLDRVNTGLAVKFYYRLSSYFFGNDFILVAGGEQHTGRNNKIVKTMHDVWILEK